MSSYITAIGTANPGEAISQSAIANFMCQAMELNSVDERKLKTLYRATGIRQRFSVIPEYAFTDSERNQFYPKNQVLEPFPSVGQRMQWYQRNALDLALKAVRDGLTIQQIESTTHLITVSCTGMYAPGIDIELIQHLGLSNQTQRTCINFMGCYAAITALRTASQFVKADPQAKVLVVCVELCSIHFQKSMTDDHLLANALFADGAAAVLVESGFEQKALQLERFYSDLLPDGQHDMAWHIGDFGFEMKLSAYVPTLIGAGIKALTTHLLQNLSISQVDFWAVHPGGKRILEEIEKALQITKEAQRFSYQVLQHFGNMSSPTVLFVIKAIWEQIESDDADQSVVSFAFGPGLTVESMLMKTVCK